MNVRVIMMLFMVSISSTTHFFYATTEQEEAKNEFMHIFGSIIEDGFFGGVKWGIAAALYQLLYKCMSVTLFAVPKLFYCISASYIQWRDNYLGRPPLLQIHELQVLVALLTESLKEYEAMIIPGPAKVHECAYLPSATLAAVMQHINDYLVTRSPRYENSSLPEDKEILFFLTLIVNTIGSILNCIECISYQAEVVVTVKTTVIIINKLILLLQGPLYDKDLYDPAGAWFSGKE